MGWHQEAETLEELQPRVNSHYYLKGLPQDFPLPAGLGF